jgi:dihydropteroate synthase
MATTLRNMPPLVMGVVNVTPDSFSDGGRHLDPGEAIAHGRRLAEEGADVLDIGGESTRPGADAVDVDTELARVIPVIEGLAPLGIRLSVDTTKPEVARAAVAAGASLINDVSASLEAVAAELGAGWIAMHRRGDPKTMQQRAQYDDVVREVCDELAAAAARGRRAGVGEIWLDPGIGFGKTTNHNLALLAHLESVVALGYPVCVGVSRKRFLGELLAASDGVDHVDADDRREGSLAAATTAIAAGARMVRVHDVRMTVHAVRVVAAAV